MPNDIEETIDMVDYGGKKWVELDLLFRTIDGMKEAHKKLIQSEREKAVREFAEFLNESFMQESGKSENPNTIAMFSMITTIILNQERNFVDEFIKSSQEGEK